MTNDFTSLSDSERALLMALHDCESDRTKLSFLRRLRVSGLLRAKPEAGEFLGVLAGMSAQVSSALSESTPELNSSLWSSISQRIEQEERAAFYLGRRQPIVAESKSSQGRFFLPLRFGWGASGVAVATSFFIFFAGQSSGREQAVHSNPAQSNDQIVSARSGGSSAIVDRRALAPRGEDAIGSAGLQFASQQREIAQADLPQIIEPSFSRSPSMPSVDWVHSDGAVRFFSDPQRNSTMIWVKKRAPIMRYYASASEAKSVITPHIRDRNRSSNLDSGAPFDDVESHQSVVTR